MALPERKLAGHHKSMSLADNQTFELWRGFMPDRSKVTGSLPTELFSVRVYPPDAKWYDPNQLFEKWAAVEVTDFKSIGEGFDTMALPGGLYAVFHYKGLNTDTRIFEYIFRDWLPASEYVLEERPHFEILGPKYRNNDPESEEEIYLPIRLR